MVGAWNPRIFTADWLSNNVFRVANVGVEVPTNPGFPYRFTANNVQIVPSASRVVFTPSLFDDATLNEMERQAIALLEALPHTPLAGVGTNFGFIEPEPNPDLLHHFDLSDTGEIAVAGYAVTATVINRTLSWDGGSMNFTLSLQNNRVLADFNLHRAVANCTQAAASLLGSIVQDANRARTFLQQAYAFNLTAEVA